MQNNTRRMHLRLSLLSVRCPVKSEGAAHAGYKAVKSVSAQKSRGKRTHVPFGRGYSTLQQECLALRCASESPPDYSTVPRGCAVKSIASPRYRTCSRGPNGHSRIIGTGNAVRESRGQ